MDAVTGLKYETSTRTLLMVVKSTCGFCRQSMTFYKQLASLKGASGHSQLVAACLEDAATCSRFFRDSGVAIDAVVSVQPGALRIRGTPTLLLVNSSGTIERIWTGKLTEQGERDVLTTVAGF